MATAPIASSGGSSNFSNTLAVENAGAAELGPAFKMVVASTVTAVATLCRGTTPSVTWEVRHAASAIDRTAGTLIASGTTTSVTVGDTAAVSVAVPAGDWVWLRTTAQSGTVLEFEAVISGAET